MKYFKLYFTKLLFISLCQQLFQAKYIIKNSYNNYKKIKFIFIKHKLLFLISKIFLNYENRLFIYQLVSIFLFEFVCGILKQLNETQLIISYTIRRSLEPLRYEFEVWIFILVFLISSASPVFAFVSEFCLDEDLISLNLYQGMSLCEFVLVFLSF